MTDSSWRKREMTRQAELTCDRKLYSAYRNDFQATTGCLVGLHIHCINIASKIAGEGAYGSEQSCTVFNSGKGEFRDFTKLNK